MATCKRPRSEFPADGTDLPALGYEGSADQKGVDFFSVTLHPLVTGDLQVTGRVRKKLANTFETQFFEGVKPSKGAIASTISGIPLATLRQLDPAVRREWEATFNDLIDYVSSLFYDDCAFLERSFLASTKVLNSSGDGKERRCVEGWIITRKASEYGYYYWAEHSEKA